jgi:hypothetical protein
MTPAEQEVRLSDHPRARRQIEVARGWAGLVAFALAGWLSYRAGVPAFEAGIRALVAGVVGYVAVWALTVAVWRHLAVAELEAARQAAEERRRTLLEASRRHGAEQADAVPPSIGG